VYQKRLKESKVNFLEGTYIDVLQLLWYNKQLLSYGVKILHTQFIENSINF